MLDGSSSASRGVAQAKRRKRPLTPVRSRCCARSLSRARDADALGDSLDQLGHVLIIVFADDTTASHALRLDDIALPGARGDPGGGRTAWRSALRRQRRSLWWWRRASFFQTTFLGASPVHPTSWAAAFRSAGAPAPTCHSRPSGLRAVAGISAADS